MSNSPWHRSLEPRKRAVTPQFTGPNHPCRRLVSAAPRLEFSLADVIFQPPVTLPLHHQPFLHYHAKQPWPTDETGSPAAEATDSTRITETDGAIGTGPETATTTAGATTARATKAGTETGTTGGTARAPETEATGGARALLAASGATTGAMALGTAATGGEKTVGRSHSGSAETGA